jgi:hypothetical protein
MEPRDSESARLRTSEPQKKSFMYTRIIPELNYASRFYSKMLKRVRIYPAMRDEQDQTEAIKSGPPVDLLDRIQDPGGGRSQIQGSYGRLMFITGEGVLFGRELDTAKERWAFVSTSEVQEADGKILWTPRTGVTPKEYTASQAVAYRMWFPDPEHSGDAESSMMSVLEIAEELRILTKAVRSTAVSRMLNGILKVPSEISFGSDEAGVDDDPEENKFLADLIDHITGAIENAGTAEAASPFLAEGAAEFLAMLEWMETHNPEKDYLEQGLRTEAVNRLAVGLDMPPEILKGLADANHWAARQIMHDAWKSHGASIAEQFCDDLAEAYLRPALREAKFADVNKVVIAYDDADVVVSPDRSDDADRAWDRGSIGWEGHRELKGIPDSMRASTEEEQIWMAIKMRNPLMLKGTRFDALAVAAAPIPSATPGPDPTADGNRPAADGPPNPGPAGVSRQESRSLKLHGGAEFALLRCRELAGARLRTLFKNRHNSVVMAQIEGRSNPFVAAILGREQLIELEAPEPLQLVKNGAESFYTLCLEWGIEETQGKALVQMIEVYAAKTLFEPRLPSFPAGFAAQCDRAYEVSMTLEQQIVDQNNNALARLSGMLGGEPVVV